MVSVDDNDSRGASLSSALTTIFRGKLCDTLLRNRSPISFSKDEIIYDVGDTNRTFFFIKHGVVKVGTVTEDGHEIIHDIRTDGDVVGELCAYELPHRDRAVVLDQTEVVAIPYTEIVAALQKNPKLLQSLVEAFCISLADAYEQMNQLAVDDTVHRLIKVLLDLAARLGRPAGEVVEIRTYLTQEEISKMVMARRERVSTGLNLLRRRGMVRYSPRGHLFLDVEALKNYRA